MHVKIVALLHEQCSMEKVNEVNNNVYNVRIEYYVLEIDYLVSIE